MFAMARTFRRRVGMLVSLQVICLFAALRCPSATKNMIHHRARMAVRLHLVFRW